MLVFVQSQDIPRLYVGRAADDEDPADSGWLALVVSKRAESNPPRLTLAEALGDSRLLATFVYAATQPTDVGRCIAAVDESVRRSPANRLVLWLVGESPAAAMGLADDGSSMQGNLTAPLVEVDGTDALSLSVLAGVGVRAAPDSLVFSTPTGSKVAEFDGTHSPGPGQVAQISVCTLHLAGVHRGCLEFDTALQRQFLCDPSGFACGFQVTLGGRSRLLSQWLPLALGDRPSATDRIAFTVLIDPSDPWNLTGRERSLPDRTAFVFKAGADLWSCYRTTAGQLLHLLPIPGPLESNVDAARLVLTQGAPSGPTPFQAAPAGDFVLTVAGSKDDVVEELMGGLEGTEAIGVRAQVAGGYAGDRLRFLPYQPAHVPAYPPRQASVVAPPVDSTDLLGGDYLTSWATIRPAPGSSGHLSYVAQPRGASLYGQDGTVSAQQPGLLGPVDLAVSLSDEVPAFPLLPYAGLVTKGQPNGLTRAQVTGIERTIVAPLRRAAVARQTTGAAVSKLAAARVGPTATVPAAVTTPSALLVTLNPDASWAQLLLGQNTQRERGLRQLCFRNPDRQLQDAFQTNGLFLVAANSTHLGAVSAGEAGDSAPQFCNDLNIDDWVLRADVGRNQPGDYRNVLIVKARQGRLVDLVARPQAWTQAQEFATPSDEPGTDGQPQELPALSEWLHDYLTDAIERAASAGPDAAYFQNFAAMAQDENWTGILVLRATVAELPPDLAGIVNGVTTPDDFCAHHLGINVSQLELVDGTPQVTGPSSVFGLVYYVDPQLDQPPVPPEPGVTFAFRLLELKALFENTAVKRFDSQAQLTLNEFFGMPVKQMAAPAGSSAANVFNTIVLEGSFQMTGGHAAYALSAKTDAWFTFDSNIITKVELTGARMITRSAGPPVVSAFALSGFIDFATITQGDPFDILSFGSDPDHLDATRRGLRFSNLNVVITGASAESDAPVPRPVLDASEIAFDLATSTPRDGSLAREFALTLETLTVGDAEHTPSSGGFLPVVADVPLTGVNGKPWYGLRFALSLGSPGKLAGSLGLTSTLLLAWSPTSAADRYEAFIGLELPGAAGGAKLISLENVLKLSIGQVRLTLDPGDDGRAGGYVLMLTEIALTFLGLAKIPPSGSTVFYLFGNPDREAQASSLGWYARYARDAESSTTAAASVTGA